MKKLLIVLFSISVLAACPGPTKAPKKSDQNICVNDHGRYYDCPKKEG